MHLWLLPPFGLSVGWRLRRSRGKFWSFGLCLLGCSRRILGILG